MNEILNQVNGDFGLQAAILALFLLLCSLVGGFGRMLFLTATLMQFGRFFLMMGFGGSLFAAFS